MDNGGEFLDMEGNRALLPEARNNADDMLLRSSLQQLGERQ